MNKPQERLNDEYSVIFGLARFVNCLESVVLNVYCAHLVRHQWCLRSLQCPPVFLSHHDVPLLSAEVSVFNDVDSPSLFLLISTRIVSLVAAAW